MGAFWTDSGNVRRRSFLSLLGATAGGTVLAGSTAGVRSEPTVDSGDALQADDAIAGLSFYSTAGQVDPNYEELDDDEHVVVRASEDAYVTISHESTDPSAVTEYEDAQIPLVSQDGTVMAFGSAGFLSDDRGGFRFGNEEFVLNAFDELIGGEDGEGEDVPTVLWDESHDQFRTLEDHVSFRLYAEDHGYDLQALEEFDAGSGLDALQFYSAASQISPAGDALTDDEHVVVRAEDSAANVDADENGDAYSYEDESIPLVSMDGSVAGFGAMLVDDANEFEDNDAFVRNVWDDLVGTGVVLFDDGHDQFYDSTSFSDFLAAAEEDGYVVEPTTDFAHDGGPVLQLELDTCASQVSPAGGALTDDAHVVAWAEDTAYNADVDENGDAYSYEDEPIPVVSRDDGVVGFGSILVEDANGVDPNNIAFLRSVWDAEIGGGEGGDGGSDTGGTVLWDQGHGQFYDTSDVSEFVAAAEDAGYAISETEDLLADLADADAVVVTDPAEAFTDEELAALSSFVDDGGTLFLHDQGDFDDFDATANLNAVAEALDLAFRFNDDQVEDAVRNEEGLPFVPKTSGFNETVDYFGEGEPALERADGIVITSPAAALSDAELAALSSFVDDGGAVFLHDQADYQDHDATANLNAVAAELDLAFRFNDDQVEDTSSGWDAHVFQTGAFNDTFDYFGDGASTGLEDADGLVLTTPQTEVPDAELEALSEFVADGGALFLFDQSDFGGHDETERFNAIADHLDLAFRFNGGQVEDEANNAGPVYIPLASDFTESFDYFADRPGIDLEIEREGAYYGEVSRVFDGDTVDVEFEESDYAYTETVRLLGIDTAETGDAVNTSESWMGIDDDAHLETWGNEAHDNAMDLFALEGGPEDVTEGRRVKLTFDEVESLRGNFGRLLGYLEYDSEDPKGDDFDVSYNRETIREGYTRVYSSGFSRHDEYSELEEEALADGVGVWSASDLESLPEIRNDPVDELYVPDPASVRTASGPLSLERAPVTASGTAEQEGGEVDYADVPLAGVDEDARVAALGGIPIAESYESAEGYPVDTAGYGNFVFLSNLIDYLSAATGHVLIEGGHGQFGAEGSISLEDAAYYQRFLEGVGTRFRQVNDVVNTLPEEAETPRAVVLSAPARAYEDDELAALAEYRASGGAVILLGSANASDDHRHNLNDVAAGLGSDLRIAGDRVLDPGSNLNDDETVPVTSAFDESYPLFDAYEEDEDDGDDGDDGDDDDGDDGEDDEEIQRYLELIANDEGVIDDAALERATDDWAAGRTDRAHLEAAMDAYETGEPVAVTG